MAGVAPQPPKVGKRHSGSSRTCKGSGSEMLPSWVFSFSTSAVAISPCYCNSIRDRSYENTICGFGTHFDVKRVFPRGHVEPSRWGLPTSDEEECQISPISVLLRGSGCSFVRMPQTFYEKAEFTAVTQCYTSFQLKHWHCCGSD